MDLFQIGRLKVFSKFQSTLISVCFDNDICQPLCFIEGLSRALGGESFEIRCCFICANKISFNGFDASLFLRLFPKNTNSPLTKRMTRSNRENVRGVGEWMVAQIVVPSATRPFTTVITSLAVYESSPEVGSSKNNTLGSVINAIPIFTLFA